jgi:hypothetical protein
MQWLRKLPVVSAERMIAKSNVSTGTMLSAMARHRHEEGSSFPCQKQEFAAKLNIVSTPSYAFH